MDGSSRCVVVTTGPDFVAVAVAVQMEHVGALRVALPCLIACGAGGHGQAAAAAQDGLYSSCCHWAILPPGPNGQDSVAFSMFSQHIACTCASICETRAVCVLEKNLKPLRAVWYQLLIYHGKLTCLALMGPHLNFCLTLALSESFIPRK